VGAAWAAARAAAWAAAACAAGRSPWGGPWGGPWASLAVAAGGAAGGAALLRRWRRGRPGSKMRLLLQRLGRGLEFAYLHYVYRPLLFAPRVAEIHECVYLGVKSQRATARARDENERACSGEDKCSCLDNQWLNEHPITISSCRYVDARHANALNVANEGVLRQRSSAGDRHAASSGRTGRSAASSGGTGAGIASRVWSSVRRHGFPFVILQFRVRFVSTPDSKHSGYSCISKEP
jgi:hypothetical protein